VLAVEQKIAVVMRDVLGQLGTVVDRYEATFDEKDTENYKRGLYVYVDKELEQELANVGSTVLSELHDEAPRYLIGKQVRIFYGYYCRGFCTSLLLLSFLPRILNGMVIIHPSPSPPLTIQGSTRSYCSCQRMSCPGSPSWSGLLSSPTSFDARISALTSKKILIFISASLVCDHYWLAQVARSKKIFRMDKKLVLQ
jgi:hypothetical protein